MPEDAETELIEDLPVEVVEIDKFCCLLHVVSYDTVEKLVVGDEKSERIWIKRVNLSIDLTHEDAARLMLMEDVEGDVVAIISPNMAEGMRKQTL